MKEDIQNGSRWLEPQEALKIANKILDGEYGEYDLATLLVTIYAAGSKHGIKALKEGLLKSAPQVGMGAS